MAMEMIDHLIYLVITSTVQKDTILIVEAQLPESDEKPMTSTKCCTSHLKVLQETYLGKKFETTPIQIGATCFAYSIPLLWISNLVVQQKLPQQLEFAALKLQELSFYLTHSSLNIQYGLAPSCRDMLTIIKRIGELSFVDGRLIKLFRNKPLKEYKQLMYFYLREYGPLFCSINLFKKMSSMLLLSKMGGNTECLQKIKEKRLIKSLARMDLCGSDMIVTDKMAHLYIQCDKQIEKRYEISQITVGDQVVLQNGSKGKVVVIKRMTKHDGSAEKGNFIGIEMNKPNSKPNYEEKTFTGTHIEPCKPNCGYWATLKEIKYLQKLDEQQLDEQKLNENDIKSFMKLSKHDVILVGIKNDTFIFINSHRNTPVLRIHEDCMILANSDAMAVDIKSFNYDEYKKVLGSYSVPRNDMILHSNTDGENISDADSRTRSNSMRSESGSDYDGYGRLY